MTGRMTVTEALETRFTCRDFLPDPVPEAIVRDILTRAIRAPSGGNIQPQRLWVLAGEDLSALTSAVAARVGAGLGGDRPGLAR
jgi:nitroreductase